MLESIHRVHTKNYAHTCICLCFVVLMIYWNGNAFIFMKFSSLAALEVVKMTTSNAANDENFIKMMTFSFQRTSLALGQSQDWSSASEATLKYIGKSLVHIVLNHSRYTKFLCIFYGIYCIQHWDSFTLLFLIHFHWFKYLVEAEWHI